MKTKHMLTLAFCALFGSLVFGCEEEPDPLPVLPQIFPRINPINICEVEMGRQAKIDVMLDNRGQNVLNISGIEVLHDRNCAFTPPNGDIRIFDNDDNDSYAATVRSRASAFMQVRYAPQQVGEDSVTVVIHSNAENFPDLELTVCGAGSNTSPLSCMIRTDPACSSSGTTCTRDTGCAMRCSETGGECMNSDECPGDANYCYSPEYCVLDDGYNGTCQCRPCATPPNEEWGDCDQT